LGSEWPNLHDCTNSVWEELKFIPIIGYVVGIEVGSFYFIFPSFTSRLPIKKKIQLPKHFKPQLPTSGPQKTLNLTATQKQKWCWSNAIKDVAKTMLQKMFLQKITSASMASKCTSTFFFLYFFFTLVPLQKRRL